MARRAMFATASMLMAWMLVSTASAQTTTATVTGSVKDTKGGVIPGASAVLTSDTRGTRVSPVFTNGSGDFVFVNVTPDTYTLEVTMDGFKTLKRIGIDVASGARLTLGSLTIEVGGTSETVDVTGEAPAIQSQSGERSFTVSANSVENLPIANRSFTALASLAPGVSGIDRIGGGTRNITMDGVSTMDTGSNSILLMMNVESIAEVRVLVSGYQAEFGRQAGVQITAVTKSGTNRFRGSVYDIERNSDWNANSQTNILNSSPKAYIKERDWGYSIGGPVGKPGGSNKLFFFYAQEYEPRTAGNNVVQFRLPTLLERAGDFSKSTDNNGNPYPYIKDPRLSGACNAASQVACFADGGVVGKIPADMLYQTGLNILKTYPVPTIDPVPAGQAYNFELTRPTQSLLGWQPAVRVDYQPKTSLRLTYKFSGAMQSDKAIMGSLPGFNDSKQPRPIVTTTAISGNYTINSTTFLEAVVGRSGSHRAGCVLGANGPTFCASGVPTNPGSNRITAGLADLPFIFPDFLVLDPQYYLHRALGEMKVPIWDGKQMLMAPPFAWGSRVGNAPPNVPFPNYIGPNITWDTSASLTKVTGRHTFKAGFYSTDAYLVQQAFFGQWNGTLSFAQDAVGTNPFDTSFGFANAAIGSFSSYTQKNHYVETAHTSSNREAYVQDNWKVNGKLTLDYGVRFVNQRPTVEKYQQGSNFLPQKWDAAQAPTFYIPGCANGVYPCTGTNRQAMNARTGQFLGPNTTIAIGTLVPNTGNSTNGLFRPGQGVPKGFFYWPALAVAPRFGAAYDLSGNQTFVFRGGLGLYFDRPTNGPCNPCGNPPTAAETTIRYGQLQNLKTAGLILAGAPGISSYQEHAELPSSIQWNGGVQMTLPWSSALDVEYAGSYGFNQRGGNTGNLNINTIDLGAGFLSSTQDPTLAASATPGASSYATTAPDLLRFYQGYGAISEARGFGWRTYHSLQIAFSRRFQKGVSLGFNDTIGISDKQNAAPRMEHVNGQTQFRADQADADALLGSNNPIRHTMKGTFVWDLPDLPANDGIRRVVGLVVNDWQLSGVWSATTGSAYIIGFSYQNGGSNVNLTGSPDFAARTRVVGDTGGGCDTGNVYKQFSTSAFQGPLGNSVGLESGNGYLKGCFSSTLDLAVARNIRLPKGRNVQIRLDMFNAPNTALITGRNTTMNLGSPSDPVTITNLTYDPITGALNPNRSLPKNAGFGTVNAYSSPRTIQAQIRFSF